MASYTEDDWRYIQLQNVANAISEMDPSFPIDIRKAEPDAVVRLTSELAQRYPAITFTEMNYQRWTHCGDYFRIAGQHHQALLIYRSLCSHLHDVQTAQSKWWSKGTPLIWMSDCFFALQFHVHANRYAMLAHCEDAIGEKGKLNPNLGVYWRAISRHGISHYDLERYAKRLVTSGIPIRS